MDGRGLSDSWQLCTSLRVLSKETGLSLQNIRSCIGKLQRTGEITFRTLPTHQQSIITICNSDSYQASKRQTAPIAPQLRPDVAPIAPLPKEYKNIRIKKVRKSTTTTRAHTKKISLIFQKKKHQKKTNKRKLRKKVFFRFLFTMMFGWVQ